MKGRPTKNELDVLIHILFDRGYSALKIYETLLRASNGKLKISYRTIARRVEKLKMEM